MKTSNDDISAERLFDGAVVGIEVSGYQFSRAGMNGGGVPAPILSEGSWLPGRLPAATSCVAPAAVPGILYDIWFAGEFSV